MLPDGDNTCHFTVHRDDKALIVEREPTFDTMLQDQKSLLLSRKEIESSGCNDIPHTRPLSL